MNLELLEINKVPVRRTLVLLDECSIESNLYMFVSDETTDNDSNDGVVFHSPTFRLSRRGGQQSIALLNSGELDLSALPTPKRILRVDKSTQTDSPYAVRFFCGVTRVVLVLNITFDSEIYLGCLDFINISGKWSNGSLNGTMGHCLVELNKNSPYNVLSFQLLE